MYTNMTTIQPPIWPPIWPPIQPPIWTPVWPPMEHQYDHPDYQYDSLQSGTRSNTTPKSSNVGITCVSAGVGGFVFWRIWSISHIDISPPSLYQNCSDWTGDLGGDRVVCRVLPDTVLTSIAEILWFPNGGFYSDEQLLKFTTCPPKH